MSKLIEKLKNDTDFDVCAFKMNSGKYVVTVYDSVSDTHEMDSDYDTLDDALSRAEEVNDGYKIDEGKRRVVKLTESQLRSIVTESVKRVISESRGLKSKKLFDIVKEYGLPSKYTSMDLHNVSDEDVVGVFSAKDVHVPYKQLKDRVSSMGYQINAEDEVNPIELKKQDKDGYLLYAVLINRNARFDSDSNPKDGGFKDYCEKKDARRRGRFNDGAKEYQWKMGNENHSLRMENPWYNGWPKERKDYLMNQIKDVYKK